MGSQAVAGRVHQHDSIEGSRSDRTQRGLPCIRTSRLRFFRRASSVPWRRPGSNRVGTRVSYCRSIREGLLGCDTGLDGRAFVIRSVAVLRDGPVFGVGCVVPERARKMLATRINGSGGCVREADHVADLDSGRNGWRGILRAAGRWILPNEFLGQTKHPGRTGLHLTECRRSVVAQKYRVRRKLAHLAKANSPNYIAIGSASQCASSSARRRSDKQPNRTTWR